MIMLINVTIQTFLSENELKLSVAEWDKVKHNYLSELHNLGLHRYTTTRIWNREEKHQLCHIFEYDNKEAMDACLPVWQEIRKPWRGDFISKAIDYRGVQIDCQERQTD